MPASFGRAACFAASETSAAAPADPSSLGAASGRPRGGFGVGFGSFDGVDRLGGIGSGFGGLGAFGVFDVCGGFCMHLF